MSTRSTDTRLARFFDRVFPVACGVVISWSGTLIRQAWSDRRQAISSNGSRGSSTSSSASRTEKLSASEAENLLNEDWRTSSREPDWGNEEPYMVPEIYPPVLGQKRYWYLLGERRLKHMLERAALGESPDMLLQEVWAEAPHHEVDDEGEMTVEDEAATVEYTVEEEDLSGEEG